MARFHFRLERVLSVRRHEEERERVLFGAALRRKLEAEMGLEEVRARLAEAMDHATVLSSGRPTIEDFVRLHEYRLALFARERDAERTVDEAAVALEQQRLRLVEARKRRRALEMLRERKLTEWRHAEEEREQAEIDEIGMMNVVRREAEERDALFAPRRATRGLAGVAAQEEGLYGA